VTTGACDKTAVDKIGFACSMEGCEVDNNDVEASDCMREGSTPGVCETFCRLVGSSFATGAELLLIGRGCGGAEYGAETKGAAEFATEGTITAEG
jgi:hypothetical protein